MDELYAKAMLSDGHLKSVRAELAAVASNTRLPGQQRVQARLIESQLLWRHGDLEAATVSVDSALVITPGSVEALLLQARLLEAGSQFEKAFSIYERAIVLTKDIEAKEKLRLRMAMLQTDNENASALIDLALQRGQEFRNRTAVALAVLGQPEKAIELYKVSAEKPRELFQQRTRLAGWAMQAGNNELAKNMALEAALAAPLSRDRLYAFSMLAEVHRTEGTLDKLIERLVAIPSLGSEGHQVLVDLLTESERIDDAIALLQRQEDRSELSPAQQSQLIRMYQYTGNNQALVSEYSRLITEQPDSSYWPKGLAEYYVTLGDRKAATGIWNEFITRNQSDMAALLAGAEQMTAMGFENLAIEALDKHMARNGDSVAALLFMFDRFQKTGDTEKLKKTLGRLDGALSPADPGRADLANAYERVSMLDEAIAVWNALDKAAGGLSYDQNVRRAWLSDKTGNAEAALDIWWSMWHETKSTSRRVLIEDKIITLAAQMGVLADIVVDLEEKLADGQASGPESAFLVRIYTKVSDAISAVEIIGEYFDQSGGNEVERLRQQAKVFQQLEDTAGYEHTAMQLIEIDPDNKADYLSGLLFNRIEENEVEELSDLLPLLDELREANKEAIGGEFEAGILIMTGFIEEAITAYRRAIAESPQRGDNYLLLADILKKEGRAPEAVAMFQYLAETADNDDTFLVAIDGIVNMVGAQRIGQSPDQRSLDRLMWAQRAILARLAEQGDKYYLYQILSDLTEERGDSLGQIVAIENSLPQSGDRLSAILRQLINLTSENQSFFGSAGYRDPIRNLAYSRRLIALNEELPPDVYINLAEELLSKGDPTSAAKAFDMALDITGRASIQQQAAEKFDEAGYTLLAIERFEKALLSDGDNLSIILKLANLRERKGQTRDAHNLYANGLEKLLRRQDVKAETASGNRSASGQQINGTVAAEFQKNKAELLFGLVATFLLEGVEYQQHTVERFSVLAEEELNRVIHEGLSPEPSLRTFPRLYHLAGAARYMAVATGMTESTDKLDAKLLEVFSSDREMAVEIIDQRMAAGLKESAASLVAIANLLPEADQQLLLSKTSTKNIDDVMQTNSAINAALYDKDFRRAAQLALMAGNQNQAFDVASQWLNMTGQLQTAMQWVLNQKDLSEERKRNFIREAFRHIRAQKKFDYILADAGLVFIKAEEMIGQRLFSDKEIFDSIGSQQQQFWLISLLYSDYVKKQLSDEYMVKLLRYGLDSKDDRLDGLFFSNAGFGILGRDFDSGYMQDISDIVTEFIQRQDIQGIAQYRSPVMVMLRFLDGVKSRAVMEVAISAWQAKYKDGVDYYSPLLDLKSNDAKSAVSGFSDLIASISNNRSSINDGVVKEILSFYGDKLLPTYEDVLRDKFLEVNARVDGESLSSNMRNAFLNEKAEIRSEKEQIAYLEELLDSENISEAQLLELHGLYAGAHLLQDALRISQKLYEINPENSLYQAMVFKGLAKLENYASAMAFNRSVSNDMRMSDFYENLASQSHKLGIKDSSGLSPFLPVDSDFRNSIRAIAEKTENASADLAELFSMARQKMRGSTTAFNHPATKLFQNWSEFVGQRWDGVTLRFTTKPRKIDLLKYKQGEGMRVANAILSIPSAEQQLEDFARTFPVKETDNLRPLFAYLLQSYELSDQLDAKLEFFSEKLMNGEASHQDFSIWLALAGARSTGSVSLELLQKMEEQITRYSRPYQLHLLQIARIYAKSGKLDRSREAYRLLISGIKEVRASTETIFIAKLELVDEISLISDAETKQALMKNLLDSISPSDSQEYLQSSYRQFHQYALFRLKTPNAAFKSILDNYGEPDAYWSAESLLQMAGLSAQLGEHERGLGYLRILAQKNNASRPEISGLSANDQRAANRYRLNVFGLAYSQLSSARSAVSDNILLNGRFAFAVKTQSEKSDIEWLKKSAEYLYSLRDDGSVNQDNLIALQAAIAYQLRAAGDMNSARQAMNNLSSSLAGFKTVSGRSLSVAFELSAHTGIPLLLNLQESLFSQNRLPPGLMAGFIDQVANQKGDAKALELGKEAVTRTQSDALLATLAEIAGREGDAELSEQFATARRVSIAAEEYLRTSDI
ncbi:hypothetical protein QSV34_12435 [Porticoccus sp. W117]|nr:hypothetical protein [Porticoccus sp. W117]